MDKAHQMNLLLGAAKDYQNGLISLGNLIATIVGLLSILEDQVLSDQLFRACFTLEEINAYTFIGDYDFETKGKPIVDRAVNEIIAKVGSYPAPPNQ
jgi:hypothetical protein